MTISDLLPDDEIRITGTSNGVHYHNVRMIVATVSPPYVKVWPYANDGKLWFHEANVERIELLLRYT